MLGMKVVIFLLTAALLLTLYNLALPSDAAKKEYRALVAKTETKGEKERAKEPYIASQHRKGVVKNIYTNKESLHSRVIAAKSRLTYDKNGGGDALIEEMEELTCLVQMELFFLTEKGDEVIVDKEKGYCTRNGGRPVAKEQPLLPVQKVRLMKAAEARYTYTTKSLLADHPSIAEYRVAGHTLPESFENALLLIDGVAESATVSFERDKVLFKAKQLKGTLRNKGESI